MKFAADGTIILKMPRVFFTATKKTNLTFAFNFDIIHSTLKQINIGFNWKRTSPG